MSFEYKAIIIAFLVMIPMMIHMDYTEKNYPEKWKSDDYWVPPLVFAVCWVVIFVNLIIAVIRW